MTVQRKCKREQSQACLNFAECSLSSNTVQRYKKNRQNAIVVPNVVHCSAFPDGKDRLRGGQKLRGDAVGATSRRIAICVGTWKAARRDVVLGR